jgi:hypothetical protein
MHRERTVRERLGDKEYTLLLKGSTVVSIYPAGENGPLYQNRSKYRGEATSWTTVEQFVPDNELSW